MTNKDLKDAILSLAKEENMQKYYEKFKADTPVKKAFIVRFLFEKVFCNDVGCVLDIVEDEFDTDEDWVKVVCETFDNIKVSGLDDFEQALIYHSMTDIAPQEEIIEAYARYLGYSYEEKSFKASVDFLDDAVKFSCELLGIEYKGY